MANSKIYARNGLTYGGVTLKNGTGGGAPALDETSDWPMRFALSRDRYTYWRTAASRPNPVTQVDFDLGGNVSVGAAGFAMVRYYGSTPPDASFSIDIYYDVSASGYPPAWVYITSFFLTADDNFVEFSAVSGRYWRFDVLCQDSLSNAIPFSGKLWIVNAADIHDLGASASPGTTITNRRIRRELRTPAGVAYQFEPAQALGSQVRLVNNVWRADNGTIQAKIRDVVGALDTRFIFVDYDGNAIETTLTEGVAGWTRRFSPPALYDINLPLLSHP